MNAAANPAVNRSVVSALVEASSRMLSRLEAERLTVAAVDEHLRVLGDVADLWSNWLPRKVAFEDRARIEEHTVRFLRCYERIDEFCDSPEAFAEAVELLTPSTPVTASRVLFEASGSFSIGPDLPDAALRIALTGFALRRSRTGSSECLLVCAPGWLHDAALAAGVSVGPCWDDPGDDVRDVLAGLWDPVSGCYRSIAEAFAAAEALA